MTASDSVASEHPDDSKSETAAKERPELFQVSKQERRLLSWINIVYAVVFVVVGLPIWWRTTSVYRAWLPHADIEALQTRRLIVMQYVEVISCDPWSSSNALSTLEVELWPALAKDAAGSDRVQVRYQGSVRECTMQESEIFRTAMSLDDLENSLEPVRTLSVTDRSLIFFIIPYKSSLLPRDSPGLLKRSGVVYLRGQDDPSQLKTMILSMIRRVLVAPKDLSASLEDLRSAKASPKPDRLRQFRAAAAYDVVFTLIHGRPERVSVQWDMPRALRFYIDPFAAKLGRYISLSFKSQFLHYVHVPIQPRRSTDQPGSFYTADNLPHLVNAFEHYLSSGASVNPTLHLIVYVPPEEHHPLRLREVRKVGLPDAFLSPRWGGVQVYNIAPQRNRSTGLVRHDVDMRKVMAVFVGQLRALLGISRSLPILVPIEASDDSNIAAWELHSWLRRRAVEQAASAVITLSSLSDLLGKVKNMVIRDDIANEVLRAVDSLKDAFDRLEEGAIVEAFAASKRALVASERAFFDPSLLELLYFNDDQKYAIYVPLFLPLGIPLLLGLAKALRFLRAVKKEKKE